MYDCCLRGTYIKGQMQPSFRRHLLLLYPNMALIPPQRLRVLFLQAQLHAAEQEHDVALMALIRERQRQQRGRRRFWVRPWIERRRLFGQYSTLFQELERESRGDYLNYIRMDTNCFAELLLRVTPRITKGPRCVLSSDFDFSQNGMCNVVFIMICMSFLQYSA